MAKRKPRLRGKFACPYKVRYTSEEQAIRMTGGLHRAYKCPHCPFWHTTGEGAIGHGRKMKSD